MGFETQSWDAVIDEQGTHPRDEPCAHIGRGRTRHDATRPEHHPQQTRRNYERNTDSHLPFVWDRNLRPPMFFGKSCLLSTEAQADARGKRRVLAVNTNTCTRDSASLRPISFSGKRVASEAKCTSSLFVQKAFISLETPASKKISRAGRYVCFSA